MTILLGATQCQMNRSFKLGILTHIWGFQLLSLIEKEVLGRTLFPIESSHDTVRDTLPEKVYPFAINGSGDRFLFDFRESENQPKIVFQNREDIILESELMDEELEEKSLKEW